MKIIYLPHCFLSFMKYKQNNGIIMSKMCFRAFFSQFWFFFIIINYEFTFHNFDFSQNSDFHLVIQTFFTGIHLNFAFYNSNFSLNFEFVLFPLTSEFIYHNTSFSQFCFHHKNRKHWKGNQDFLISQFCLFIAIVSLFVTIDFFSLRIEFMYL